MASAVSLSDFLQMPQVLSDLTQSLVKDTAAIEETLDRMECLMHSAFDISPPALDLQKYLLRGYLGIFLETLKSGLACSHAHLRSLVIALNNALRDSSSDDWQIGFTRIFLVGSVSALEVYYSISGLIADKLLDLPVDTSIPLELALANIPLASPIYAPFQHFSRKRKQRVIQHVCKQIFQIFNLIHPTPPRPLSSVVV
jgi:hypothetical protein